MKSINNLSALVSPPAVDGGKSFADLVVVDHGRLASLRQHQRRKRKHGDSQSLSLITSSNGLVTGSTNPSPTESASTSSGGRRASSSQADEVDKSKLLARDNRELQLNVLKVSPLTMLGINNKVGSSFRGAQQQQEALRSYSQQLQAGLVLPVIVRKVRDSGSLLFMLAFLGFLTYIIWDGIIVKEADINLIVHGHDSYGNVCGRNNRPIRFVEKSGKNMTDKAYTKYTLINAQFERYTLDSDRLKHGELFYVKLPQSDEMVATAQAHQPGIERFSLINSAANDQRRQQQQRRSGRERRAAPAAPFVSNVEQLRKNQTLLNNLKSTLMYQYPPMYGYNPSSPLKSSSASSKHHGSVPSAAATPRLNGGGATSDSDVNRVDAHQLEMAASQTEHSYASSAIMPSAHSLPPPAVASTLVSARRSTAPMVVTFDDRLNDSDHYEHVLVPPTSSSGYGQLRPRTGTPPSGFNQFEASSQLLYLTECVDHCPADDHVELIFYRCMPKNWRFSLFPNAINVTRTFIDEIITDLTQCYRELIYIFSLALVLSLALLLLLRFLASVIIWSCITLLISLFISMASYSWLSYYNQIIDLNALMPHGSVYSDKLATSDKWLVGSIFLTFVSFATIGAVIFMRRRILLVTTLFRESGKAIADMPLLLLQPVLTFAALVLITLAWSIGLICLQSIKDPVIDMSSGFVVFKSETLYKIMKWYHIFAFLWVSHFAIACQHYVIGASVSKWYFSTDRYNLHSPIGSSVSELILYYLGSVALGSFLVAVFKVVRIITRQIQFLVQRNCMAPGGASGQSTGSGPSSAIVASSAALNGAQAVGSTGGSCFGSFGYIWRLFIWFFDNIVMIINRDAYVEIAIHGHSFLSGAQQAFNVLASNPLKLLAIKSVSNLLLVVAKICVVFGTVSMAMILLEEKTQQLNYAWSPIVVSALYAYIVAHWFLSVYEMVIDALFICYCEDYERSKKLNSQLVDSNFITRILQANNGQQVAYMNN